jgi:hypothetical protein
LVLGFFLLSQPYPYPCCASRREASFEEQLCFVTLVAVCTTQVRLNRLGQMLPTKERLPLVRQTIPSNPVPHHSQCTLGCASSSLCHCNIAFHI